MKGCYILIIRLDNDTIISVGRIGKICFNSGYYAYVGSAMNNIEKRIERHLRKGKKIYWHIDYLLQKGKIVDIFYKESTLKKECSIASYLSRKFKSIPGFGSSDCRCKSHLFYSQFEHIIDFIENNMDFTRFIF
jgi:Uri superfamily endonuclease